MNACSSHSFWGFHTYKASVKNLWNYALHPRTFGHHICRRLLMSDGYRGQLSVFSGGLSVKHQWWLSIQVGDIWRACEPTSCRKQMLRLPTMLESRENDGWQQCNACSLHQVSRSHLGAAIMWGNVLPASYWHQLYILKTGYRLNPVTSWKQVYWFFRFTIEQPYCNQFHKFCAQFYNKFCAISSVFCTYFWGTNCLNQLISHKSLVLCITWHFVVMCSVERKEADVTSLREQSSVLGKHL